MLCIINIIEQLSPYQAIRDINIDTQFLPGKPQQVTQKRPKCPNGLQISKWGKKNFTDFDGLKMHDEKIVFIIGSDIIERYRYR